MRGFRNAPEITEFRRGMRISHNGQDNWTTVVHVDASSGGAACSRFGMLSMMPEKYYLNLAGVWERQERNRGGGSVFVHFISDDFSTVAYGYGVEADKVIRASVEEFKAEYPTVVLPEPSRPNEFMCSRQVLEDVINQAINHWWEGKDQMREMILDGLKAIGVPIRAGEVVHD